jgi:hypothetical protein
MVLRNPVSAFLLGERKVYLRGQAFAAMVTSLVHLTISCSPLRCYKMPPNTHRESPSRQSTALQDVQQYQLRRVSLYHLTLSNSTPLVQVLTRQGPNVVNMHGKHRLCGGLQQGRGGFTVHGSTASTPQNLSLPLSNRISNLPILQITTGSDVFVVFSSISSWHISVVTKFATLCEHSP